ncbi:T9SS type A sorting domain-containing protein [Polaribacter sp.]|uniref:T9SS type A sorting domain-containing protein n=1 Tax=Polaribacter sp. TaxID=1920175 RepID=UPI0040473460
MLVENIINSNHDQTINYINIHPSPVLDKLTVDMEDFDSLTIYDTLGNLIVKKNENIIDLTLLSTGIYFVTINNNKGFKTTKKIIKK